MDDRALYFLEVMIAVAVVGVVAFLIFLVNQYAKRDRPADASGSQWFAFLLAAVAIVVIAGLLIWWFVAGGPIPDGDWRGGNQAIVFMVVMGIAAALGLIVFLIHVFGGGRSRAPAPQSTVAVEETTTTETDLQEAPSSVRLVGLLGLGLAYLLLNWIYLDPAAQLDMMKSILYPAGFVVALVLMFDKATRGWSQKTGTENFREWLLCNALVVLLLLGYLNLRQVPEGAAYAGMFWDFLHVLGFLLTFWLLDRKLTRARFLIAYGYLILLPIDLLIWRLFHGLPVVEGVLFWESLWPFFILAIVFFVLEIIALIATRNTPHQTVPALKDALFVLLYAIFLIVAIPAAEAAS